MEMQAISGSNARKPKAAVRTPQPKMVTCRCEWCKEPFEARAADRKRGWGKFCSKSCKASKQEKRTGQYRNLMTSSCGVSDADDDHYRALDDSTGGWDEGGWRGDESGCTPA
jgi:hypothetical protein